MFFLQPLFWRTTFIRLMLRFKVAEDTSSSPKLVSFPVGVPPNVESMDLTVEEAGSKKKRKVHIIGEANGVQYFGADYDGGNEENKAAKLNMYTYAVGILDEKRNEVTLHPESRIFPLRPYFARKHTPVTNNSSDLSYNERKQSLAAQFGSAKKQRALRAAQSNIIMEENISGATTVSNLISSQIESKIANDKDDSLLTATERAVDNSRATMLPAYNPDAATLEEVYPIESLIPAPIMTLMEAFHGQWLTQNVEEASNSVEAEMPSFFSSCSADTRNSLRAELNTWCSVFPQDTQRVAHKMFFTLIQTYVPKVKLSKGNKDRIRSKVCHLLMLSFYIKFYLCFNKDQTATKEELQLAFGEEVPPEVLKFFTDSFTRFKKFNGLPAFTISKDQKTKLTLHLIVLALVLSEFSLDLNELSLDLSLQVSRLALLAKETGCKIIKQKIEAAGSSSGRKEELVAARLDLPLEFPTFKLPRPKK